MALDSLGLVGGVVGAVGNIIQTYEQKKQMAKIRKQVRRGVSAGEDVTARSVGGILTSPEYLTAQNFVRSFYGIGAGNVGDVRGALGAEFGGRDVGDVESRYARGTVLAGNFGQPFDTLTTDFQKGLRQAQAQRGLQDSQVGAGAEASGMAAFRANLQIGLLPQLFNLAEGPASLRAKYEPGNIAREVYRSSGGVAAYGQANPALAGPAGLIGPALTGAVQGYGAGSQLSTSNQSNSLQNQYLQMLLSRNGGGGLGRTVRPGTEDF